MRLRLTLQLKYTLCLSSPCSRHRADSRIDLRFCRISQPKAWLGREANFSAGAALLIARYRGEHIDQRQASATSNRPLMLLYDSRRTNSAFSYQLLGSGVQPLHMTLNRNGFSLLG